MTAGLAPLGSTASQGRLRLGARSVVQVPLKERRGGSDYERVEQRQGDADESLVDQPAARMHSW